MAAPNNVSVANVIDFDLPFTTFAFWFSYIEGSIDVAVNCLVASVMFLIFYLIVWGISSVLKYVFNRPRAPVDKAVVPFILSALKIVLWVQIVPILVNQIGIAVDSMIAVVSAIALAVGIALRPLVENFVMGLALTILKPFEKENLVLLAGSVKGRVADIAFAYTLIEKPDGASVYVPNSKIFGAPMTNFSRTDKARLDAGSFELAHGCDLGAARAAISEACSSLEIVLPEPPAPPSMVVLDVTQSAVVVAARVWVPAAHMFKADHIVREAVLEAFDRRGVALSVWTAAVAGTVSRLQDEGYPGLTSATASSGDQEITGWRGRQQKPVLDKDENGGGLSADDVAIMAATQLA